MMCIITISYNHIYLPLELLQSELIHFTLNQEINSINSPEDPL